MVSNPIYDPFQVLVKVYSNGTHLKQALSDTYIEEINRGRTVKIIYGVLEKDIYLNQCISVYTQKNPKLAVRIILKISLYMLIFLEKKRYMVTDCAVELCKKLGKGGVAGFVNAFLRKFDKEKVDKTIIEEKNKENIKVSYPLFAYNKLKDEYGDRADSIASAVSSGVSVRFDKNKEKYLGLKYIETPFNNNYIFENFARDEGFQKGDYTFQSVGSIAICDVIEPGKLFLDACAAPGGKSVLLAKKCDKVYSFELYPHRVELIRFYKKRMHVENIIEKEQDSSVYLEEYNEYFDGVLCDVPCSGFGTVSENPDIKLFRKEEDFQSLKISQIGIITTCSNYVKKEGYLYYSTCSIFKEENDDIIEEFLKNHDEFVCQNITSPLEYEKKKFGIQFLPDSSYGAGFYISKLRKIK